MQKIILATLAVAPSLSCLIAAGVLASNNFGFVTWGCFLLFALLFSNFKISIKDKTP